jgi:hypothetical protein
MFADLLMKKAQHTLITITYDGNNTNFPFDKLIRILRSACDDLNRLDLYEAYKISKLGDSMNVPAFGNIYSVMKGNPEHRTSFDRTVAFYQEQLASRDAKHAGKRNVSFVKNKKREDNKQPWNK